MHNIGEKMASTFDQMLAETGQQSLADELRRTGQWEEAEASWGGGELYSTDDILGSAINSLSGYFPKKITPYDEVNPFFFDEKLAKQAATKEYAPYYDEKLADYVSIIERNIGRSTEDRARTLEFLQGGKDYYLGRERRMLDRAIRSTNEGYAGRGLFFSGQRERDVRELKEEYEKGIGEYERQYEYKTEDVGLTHQRLKEDEEMRRKRYQRDIEREKEYAIESGVLQRKREAREEYELGRQKYYEGQMYG